MNNIELIETEWYFRDLMFRNFNKGVLQFDIEDIADNMVKPISDIEVRNQRILLQF